MDLTFKKPNINSSELRLPNGKLLRFDGFWPGFNSETDFALWPQLINKYCQKQNLRILGPFWKRGYLPLLVKKVKMRGNRIYLLLVSVVIIQLSLLKDVLGFACQAVQMKFSFITVENVKCK